MYITSDGTVPYESNFAFHLSDLTNSTNLTALFDQYFLHSVLAIFTFERLLSSASAPVIYTAIDYDSVAPITTVAAIQEYQSVLESVCLSALSVQRLIRPAIAMDILAAGGSTAAAGVGRTWVDCDYSTVEHYGLRSITQDLPTDAVVSLELIYTFGFRNVR